MTSYFMLRTPSGPVRFCVNTEARDYESVLVREDNVNDTKSLGQVAYEAQCEVLSMLPTWDVLTPEVRAGWEDAATADNDAVAVYSVIRDNAP